MGPDREHYEDNDVYLLLKKNADFIRNNLRILSACGTKDDTHLPTCRKFHEALLAEDIDHTYIECRLRNIPSSKSFNWVQPLPR